MEMMLRRKGPSSSTGRRAAILATALVVIAAITVAGCKGEGDDGFVVVLDAEPRGLDPRFATSDASVKIIGLLHGGLISVDNADGKPEMELARSIVQRTPTTYDVTLRDDIFFHDGHPVTAEDVEYTLTQLEEVGSPYAAIDRRIQRFETHSPQRFTLHLDEPHAPFLTDLAMGIMPAHICGGHETCPGDPVGAGPFKYLGQEGDREIRLGAFEKYFAGEPAIDQLTFRVIEDDNTRLLALLGGAVDLTQNTVQPLMLPVVQESERLEVQRAPSFKYAYIAFNLNPKDPEKKRILGNEKVRQAIAHAIDRQAIIHHKLRGQATPSTGMLSPAHWAYEPDVARYPHDPEKARQLLDEAGFPDPPGEAPRFELEFKISSNKSRKAIAQLIAQQLGEVGIEVRVRSYEWGTFFHDVKSRNFEMTTLEWPSVIEPNLYHWIFHSSNIPGPDNRSAGANRGSYSNERVDALLEAGQRETDLEKRKAIYGEVQKILADELPYISLWHQDNLAVTRRGVEDYTMTPNARLESLKVAKPAPEPGKRSDKD